MSIPREHRLRKHAEFEVVYRSGQRNFSQSFTVFYLLRPELGSKGAEGFEDSGRDPEYNRQPRVGITVGRAMGKSVVRNRIKRRVRAAVAQNLERLTRPLDLVINPKKVVLEIKFQQLCSEVARAFDVVDKKAKLGADKSTTSLQRQKLGKSHQLSARKLGK
jgi:ribonuclease P protein component